MKKTQKKLVNDGALNLWEYFKGGVLKECDEEYGKKRERRRKRDAWRWNKDVKLKQFQGQKMHTRQCVRILLSRIRGDIKALKNTCLG